MVDVNEIVAKEVVKVYFTPEKIKSMVDKIGPVMEAEIQKQMLQGIKNMDVSDEISEALYQLDLTKYIAEQLAAKLNLTVPTKRRR